MLRLLREDERLVSRVKEIAGELEAQTERGEQWKLRRGEPYRAPAGVVEVEVEVRNQATEVEQGPMEALLRFNSTRLAKVLVLAGVLGLFVALAGWWRHVGRRSQP